ncbi:hypothetical protein DSO57_1007924 [Entomophthora muscae]|uniref:Uncharacterized protein n=2 Tax=Entomophthora muscae TaxID=34485 RepID=A0ACC2U6L7_9FUNG|nr:hypothetical protein DSO57_1038798 [Entomophthora muscae]KAJ9082067.1 hypothetical protein DSO57_1007924 [Entomophthora muscae]
MNTFNFLISALCLASAATCDATKIAIKDNVNFVLKLGTCNTEADIKVEIVNGGADLPFLFPKVEREDDTVATVLSSTSAAALAASGTLSAGGYSSSSGAPAASAPIGAGGSSGPGVKAEKESGAQLLDDRPVPAAAPSTNINQALANQEENADSANVEGENKSTKRRSELNTSEDVGGKLITAYPFPGHFKIPSLKYKSINLKGKKKTVYEVYITPPEVHMSADERHSESKNFTVKVDFKCNNAKNEKYSKEYDFTVTNDARVVSLVSSAAVFAATFFFIL